MLEDKIRISPHHYYTWAMFGAPETYSSEHREALRQFRDRFNNLPDETPIEWVFSRSNDEMCRNCPRLNLDGPFVHSMPGVNELTFPKCIDQPEMNRRYLNVITLVQGNPLQLRDFRNRNPWSIIDPGKVYQYIQTGNLKELDDLLFAIE